jgi:hypothetical protein
MSAREAPATPPGTAAGVAPGAEPARDGGTPAATPAGRGRARATPVAGEAAAYDAEDCAAYTAWRADPAVAAALANAELWPSIIAEGEHAAAGEPVDAEEMQAAYDRLADVAKTLRASGNDELGHDSVALAGRAMGLASRLAGALADEKLDAAAAGEAVANAREAIVLYEADAAARLAACG